MASPIPSKMLVKKNENVRFITPPEIKNPSADIHAWFQRKKTPCMANRGFT